MRGTSAISAVIAVLLVAAGGARAQTPALLGGEPAAAGTASPNAASDLRQEIARFETHAAEWRAKAVEYQKALEEAPAQLVKIDAELARLRTPADVGTPGTASLDQLEVYAIGAEQDLALAEREASELQTEADNRSERRRQLPQLLAEAKARAAAPAVPTPASPGEDASVALVRDQLAQQRKAAFEAEVAAYEQELLSYEMRGRVLDRRIALAEQRAAREQARLDVLQKELAERRKVAATRAVESALDSIQEAASLQPAVREVVKRLAQENAELARVRTGESGVLESIDEVSRKLASVDRRLTEIDADFERLSKKVAAGELTDSLGVLLRKTRSQVPDVGKYRRFMRMRQGQIAEVQARQEDLRDQLADLTDLDKAVAKATAGFTVKMSGSDRGRLEALVRELLETRRRHISALLRDNELYFQKLVDFDAREQELVDKAEQLLSFIDERILWIPSGGAVPVKIARDSLEAIGWLARPSYWVRLAKTLLASVYETPILHFVAASLLLFAIWLRAPMRRRLHELAEQAQAPTQTSVMPTLAAIGIALAWAPWGPAALVYLGWRLSVSPEATQFVRCFAHGLIGAGVIWLTLEVPRQIVRRDGPGAAHFGWPEAAVKSLRREIGWVTSLAVPLVFVIQLFEARDQESWRESVGRIALIALFAAVTVFTHRVLREGGALRAILSEAQHVSVKPWVWRAAHLAGVAVPIVLALSAARGYYWTALRLGGSFHLTLVFAFVLLAALHLALRWTLLARRRLAFEQWRAEHEAELAATSADSDERPDFPEDVLDLGAVDVQTSRLLYTSAAVALLIGLWVLWADLVPALGVLDRVELWNTTQTRTVELTAADGTRQLHSEQLAVPITLGRVLVSVLIGFLTLVLVRNLSGLLEISLFRRLGTGPGERYAVTTLAKYAITLAGGVLACNVIGIDWSKLQWLVAAVGLGLGFGLQEIFANFVSGLIILFERPMRVGDQVIIGNLSGTVTRIRIRATWLVGGDRKEMVVPNKQFVTNHLINASLSDPTIRVEVPVGVAYGSDTEQVMRELLAVAEGHELVLSDPKPSVMFLGFGESALSFALRAYSDVSNGDRVQHELGLAVERAFREAGIEIAFPQRDVHVRSVPAAADRSEDDGEASEPVPPER